MPTRGETGAFVTIVGVIAIILVVSVAFAASLIAQSSSASAMPNWSERQLTGFEAVTAEK